MAQQVPRLRMFAGPNGSGKSTLRSVVRTEHLGAYVNPDEIASAIASREGWDALSAGITIDEAILERMLQASPVLALAQTRGINMEFRVDGQRVLAPEQVGIAYLASAVSEVCCYTLLKSRLNFSLETVMSHPDKVKLLADAAALGYRTYLYFIATEDPAINLRRIENRVKLGGHDVPQEKVIERYGRSLALLPRAIRTSNRAYIFDNSADGQERTWVAEITDGSMIEFKASVVPNWFSKAVLQEFA